MTPEQRVLRSRLAAHTMHGRGLTNTAPATAAFLERFEREADPEGVLPADERARRAEHLRRAHFTRLSLAAAKARQAKAGVS